jgi:threonine/homoserine/homoserine lactone efflux protein
MTESIIIGAGFAFAAAVQPGPLLAFLLSKVAENGWKRTLPAALSPLVSDGPIAVVVLFVLKQLPRGMDAVLQAAGGVFLLVLAGTSYRKWKRRRPASPAASGSAPHTLVQAAVVNLLNPGPYLGWSLVLGPAVMSAWSRSPGSAVVLIAAFYTTMITTLGLIIFAFGATSLLGASARRKLVLASMITLAALGLYLLVGALARGGLVHAAI